MLAVFKTGGKQYSVKAGQILKVEKLEGKQGDSISFKNILAVSDSSNHTIGSPIIKGAIIEAKILEQIRDKKIIIFKKRKRQNYRHTQGHRQFLTVLHIESIKIGDKKSTAPKKEIKKEAGLGIKKKTIDKDKKLVKKAATVKKSLVKKTTSKKDKKTKQDK